MGPCTQYSHATKPTRPPPTRHQKHLKTALNLVESPVYRMALVLRQTSNDAISQRCPMKPESIDAQKHGDHFCASFRPRDASPRRQTPKPRPQSDIVAENAGKHGFGVYSTEFSPPITSRMNPCSGYQVTEAYRAKWMMSIMCCLSAKRLIISELIF